MQIMEGTHLLPSLPPWRLRAWIIVGFFALTFVAFLLPLRHAIFVAWDDTYLIYFNPVIKEISWKTLRAAFTTYDPELYVPLTLLSYQLDYLIAGLNPFLFHLTNIILHTANALLVSWFLFLISRRPWVALAAGLFFAVHPLHTETVAWASARKDVLSTFFFLLSLIFYLRYRQESKAKPYIISLSMLLLGLLSKAMVLTLPIVLILLDFREKRPVSRRAVLEKIPYVVLSVLLGIVALYGKRDTVGVTTMTAKALMAAKSTVFYLEKIFFPFDLSVLYPYEGAIRIASPDFLLPLILLIILILAILISLRWTREIVFGVGFFLLTLTPTFINFSKGGDLYFASDRYAYIPSIGILYLVALGIERFRTARESTAERMGRTRACLAILSTALLAFTTLTFRQAQTWKDSITLFTQTLRFYPRALAAHLNLAMVYREMNELDKVKTHLDTAATIRPHARVHVAYATLFEREGDRTRALEEYRKAIEIEPKDPEPYFGIGILYERDGRIDDAVAMYEKVLSIDPKYVGTYNNLGAIALKRNDRATAREMYEKAVEIDPTFADAHFNIGVIAMDEGNIDEAILEFEKTTELDPKNSLDALENLMDLYARSNDAGRAADAARRIVDLKPDHPTAQKFLSALRERGLID